MEGEREREIAETLNAGRQLQIIFISDFWFLSGQTRSEGRDRAQIREMGGCGKCNYGKVCGKTRNQRNEKKKRATLHDADFII